MGSGGEDRAIVENDGRPIAGGMVRQGSRIVPWRDVKSRSESRRSRRWDSDADGGDAICDTGSISHADDAAGVAPSLGNDKTDRSDRFQAVVTEESAGWDPLKRVTTSERPSWNPVPHHARIRPKARWH